jgi:hypothetical protein
MKMEGAVMNGSAKIRIFERFDLDMPAVIMSEKNGQGSKGTYQRYLRRIKLRGKIIRCSSGGVAIRFNDSYAVTFVRSQENH